MLIDQFYPVIGGAEQQALRISLKLIAKGHKVLVLTRKSDKDLSDFEEYRGIEIFRLPIIGVSGKQKLKSTYPALKWLIANKNKYDIIHCHGVNPLEWGALFASFKTKKPYVIKIPLSNYFNYAGAKKGYHLRLGSKKNLSKKYLRPMMLPVLKLVRKKMINKANRIFAISPEISKSLTVGGIRHVSDIPNGIDTDFYKPVSVTEKMAIRKKLNLPVDHIIFVFSGRLAAEKNVETMLKGWHDFMASDFSPKARLLILGDGNGQTYSVEDDLKNMVLRHDIRNVAFLGSVNNVREYLQCADCFILPSLWEGMSNALLEAMSCGLPTIASNIPGNNAMIDQDKSGFLFNPLQYEILSKYINKICHDDILRKLMGERARQLAVEKYSINRVTEDILHEYKKILD